jgi:hypothetical protein
MCSFSSCYDQDSTQEEIYRNDVEPLLDIVYSGVVSYFSIYLFALFISIYFRPLPYSHTASPHLARHIQCKARSWNQVWSRGWWRSADSFYMQCFQWPPSRAYSKRNSFRNMTHPSPSPTWKSTRTKFMIFSSHERMYVLYHRCFHLWQ